MQTKSSGTNRRTFIQAASATVGLASVAPYVIADSKTDKSLITGQGEYQYEITHHWPKLPSQFTWQTTHNVAVDGEDNLYVIHEGRENQPDHPSIFVFDSRGEYVRSFGKQFQGGGHGLEVRKEGNEEFLYVTGYLQVKMFAKLSLKGDIVWEKRAPMESKVYHADEAEHPAKIWGRDRFMPTNFAFLDDGGFLLADGYGSFQIHRFDKEGNWQSCFGGEGEGKGKFNLPHGLWIDRRDPAKQKIVITDRSHNTLQVFTIDGQYLETLTGFGAPANVDAQGDLLLIPELKARVSLLGKNNQVVATLGDDVERLTADKGNKIRTDESQWIDGKFVHPHDACFDSKGNIFVAEWVGSGRISKLRKV